MISPAFTPTSDPIISRLRPRTVAEIIDQAFRLYRKHFLTFLAIIAVVHVPLQVAIQAITLLFFGSLQQSLLNSSGTGLSSRGFSSSATNEMFITLGVSYGVIFLLSALYSVLIYFSQAALTAAVADSHMDRPVSFGRSYREMVKHIGPLLGVIGLQILIGTALFIPVIILVIIGIATAFGDNSGAGITAVCLGYCMMIPTFVALAYVFIRLSSTTPSLVIENLGPRQALRRSWELLRNYWWRTFAIVGVLWLLNLVISAGPAALIAALVGIPGQLDLVTRQAISSTVTVLTTMLFLPLKLTSMTLYYFDQRVRKEGFDIEAAVANRYSQQGGLQPAMAGAYSSYSPMPAPAQPPTLGYTTPPSQYGPYTPPPGWSGPPGAQTGAAWVPTGDTGASTVDLSSPPPFASGMEAGAQTTHALNVGEVTPSRQEITPPHVEETQAQPGMGYDIAPTPEWLARPHITGEAAEESPEAQEPVSDRTEYGRSPGERGTSGTSGTTPPEGESTT